MQPVCSFRDLQVWQKAMDLVEMVYTVSADFPQREQYGLTSQIRRAAVSLASNLAEGSSKRSTREFIRFINISYGSLAEIETQLLIAQRLAFLPETDLEPLLDLSAEIGRMLNSLQNKLHEKLNSELLNS